MSAARVVMLGRPGCHLCEEALPELEELAAAAATSVRTVDIEQDDALLRAHLERIPVVLVDGRETCSLFVDARAVTAALGAPTGGST